MPRPAANSRPTRTLRPPRLPPIAIVVSRYNATITDRLLSGAARAYVKAGGSLSGLYVAEAPGAFEVLPLAAAAARSGHFAGIVAIGCIIKGETIHDEVLAHAVATGLANLAAQAGVPVGLAVLTVNTPKQGAARAGGTLGNKGQEAMEAVLRTIAECALLADGTHVRRAMLAGQAIAPVAGSAVSDRSDKARRPARKGR